VADEARAVERRLTIVNTKGLHARASAKFVQCAGKFDAQITVSKDGQTVSGTSIMGIMMLGAGPGSDVVVRARGRQAFEAVAALEALIVSRFGEDM
jgi:phosphocarrier protein